MENTSLPKNFIRKKRILIADDDPQILEALQEFLNPFRQDHGFEIVTAKDGETAIATMEASPIDLLITDIKMPKTDGIQVISHIIGRTPNIPVVVMTAFGSTETEKLLKEMKVAHYVEKPIQFDAFIASILEILAQEDKSNIDGISTSTFLQLLEMEKTTCTLAVSAGERSGSLFLREGALIHAETSSFKGMEAALEILNWSNVHIHLKKSCDIQETSISIPLTEILLESSRLKDEQNHEETVEIQLTEESGEKISFFQENDFGLELDKIETLVGIDSSTTPTQPKEAHMDIPKLLKAIDILKDNLGGALLAADIFSTEDAQSVAGWNSNAVACAIFGQFTQYINKSLKDSGFPILGRYYLLDLMDKKIVVVIPMGDFQLGMLIDGSKTQLGLVLNLAIPKAITAFEEALAG